MAWGRYRTVGRGVSTRRPSLQHGRRRRLVRFGSEAADQAVLHVVEIAHRVEVQVEQLEFVGLRQRHVDQLVGGDDPDAIDPEDDWYGEPDVSEDDLVHPVQPAEESAMRVVEE